MYWPLNDAHLVLFVLSCLACDHYWFTRERPHQGSPSRICAVAERGEAAVKVKALEVAEQRRFLVELKSKTEGKDPLIAASTTKDLAISESRSPNLQLLKQEKDSDAAPPLAS
jgi:hypothetical protein